MAIKRKKILIGKDLTKFNEEVSEHYLTNKVGRINLKGEKVGAKIYRPEIKNIIRKRGSSGITPAQLEKDLKAQGATNSQRSSLIRALRDVYDKNSPGYRQKHSIFSKRKRIVRAPIEEVPVGYTVKENVFANRNKSTVKRLSAQDLGNTVNKFGLSQGGVATASILSKGKSSVVSTRSTAPSTGPLNKANIMPINKRIK